MDGLVQLEHQYMLLFWFYQKEKNTSIHSLQDLPLYKHTAEYISEKILEVVNDVGAMKITSIVSDNASTMVKAKNLVNVKYNHIISIYCIAHHVNLLTTAECWHYEAWTFKRYYNKMYENY